MIIDSVLMLLFLGASLLFLYLVFRLLGSIFDAIHGRRGAKINEKSIAPYNAGRVGMGGSSNTRPRVSVNYGGILLRFFEALAAALMCHWIFDYMRRRKANKGG